MTIDPVKSLHPLNALHPIPSTPVGIINSPVIPEHPEKVLPLILVIFEEI